MKIQIAIIVVIFLLICVGLSGCTNNSLDIEKNKFVGTWKLSSGTDIIDIGGTVVFFSDGTTSIYGARYEIKDGKLVFSVGDGSLTYDYSFSNNDNTLTITSIVGSISGVYTKQ